MTYNFNIKENCREIKAKFQQQYPNVTQEDLECHNGSKKDDMLTNLQQRIQVNQDELREIIIKL